MTQNPPRPCTTGPNPLPSVCIVAHKAYGAFRGGHAGHIGGIERQTSMLAKWLAEKGHDVSFLTWDEGGPPIEVIDGVRLIKIARARAGIKGLRFFHPKWTGLMRAMRLADADVYYQNGSECVTGQAMMWCQRNGRGFVFSSACDTDCDPRMEYLSTALERRLFEYGLRHAHVRIVQTATQQEMLRKGFSLDSVVIPMPCPSPVPAPEPGAGSSSRRMLWLARVCRQKRPDLLLDIAEMCPEFHFDVAGPVYEDSYATEVRRRGERIANVTFHGPVNRDAVTAFYRKAAFLICTSDFEGFPNTFLEAWSHGLPILSTFDPDSIIQTHGLGQVFSDVKAMSAAIRSLTASPERYEEMSRNALRYFHENHRTEAVQPRYEEVFNRVAKSCV